MGQFSTQTLLLTFILIALGVGSLAIEGGYLLYIPLLSIIALGKLTVHLFAQVCRRPKPIRLRDYASLLCAAWLLFGTTILFVCLSGILAKQFRERQIAAEIKSSVMNLASPSDFRTSALDYRSRFMSSPEIEMPPELSAIHPVTIRATDDRMIITVYNYEKHVQQIHVLLDTTADEMTRADRIRNQRIGERLWFVEWSR